MNSARRRDPDPDPDAAPRLDSGFDTAEAADAAYAEMDADFGMRAGFDSDTGPQTPDGLPRRVRQASLAAGLRGASGPGAPQDTDGDPADRSPEQARATMAAFQNGWSLGRASGDTAER